MVEDKIQFAVPNSPWGARGNTDAPFGNSLNHGDSIVGNRAASEFITQYMHGSPVVDYNSIAFTGALGAFDGTVQRISTMPNRVQQFIDGSYPYTRYTAGLAQNMSSTVLSNADGDYRIASSGSGSYIVTEQPSGLALEDSVGSVQLMVPDTYTPFFHPTTGDFLFHIIITSQTSGTEWTAAVDCDFSVVQPVYQEALNWSDIMNHTRYLVNTPADETTMLFNTDRIAGLSGTAPLEDYDLQGLSFQARNETTQTFPLANISNSASTCRGGFYRPGTMSAYTHTIYPQFSLAQAVTGAATPATAAQRGPNNVTILRGPGYIRMMAQVTDAGLTTVDATQAAKDTSYFFGMMNAYEDEVKYPHPMAFLGDVGYNNSGGASASYRPWWRTGTADLSTTDDSVWTANFNGVGATYYTLKAPMVLDRSFVLGDGQNNRPYNVRALSPLGGTTQGEFWLYSNPAVATTIGIGYTDDAGYNAATPFAASFQSVGWSDVTGWDSPSGTAHAYMETPGQPAVTPLTLRQLAPDDHSGYTTQVNEQTIPTGYDTTDQDGMENLGDLPGLYWMNSIERYDGATPVYYPAGLRVFRDGRLLSVIIGSSMRASIFAAVPDNHLPYGSSGNLLFDPNPV